MEFSMKKMAKCLLANTSDLPDMPGIYFTIDPAYRVWYVGISKTSLRIRHNMHEKQEFFKESKVQWIAYFPWYDEADLDDWEKINIDKFKPPLNYNLTEDYDLPIIDLGYDKSQYLLRYREIQTMIKALEVELAELKPNIVTLIEANGGKLKTLELSANLTTRKTWGYSANVESLKFDLAQKQKNEQEDGTAYVKSVITYPTVRWLQ